MIRPGRQPRPDSACHSADVLTPTEAAAQLAAQRIVWPHACKWTPPAAPSRDGVKTWADDPDIRAILQLLRGKL